MTIVVHGHNEKRLELDVDTRKSLMLQLRPHKVGILGICGGNALCGTCHVTVRPDQLDLLEPMDEYEEELLDTLPERQPNSRLACQIVPKPSMDGLELTVNTRR
jgi:2Fe-2S ferredoxin